MYKQHANQEKESESSRRWSSKNKKAKSKVCFVYPQCLDNLAGPGFLPERVGSLTREAHQEAVRDLVVNNKFLNNAWVNINFIHLRPETMLIMMTEGKCYGGILVWDRECKDRWNSVFSGWSAMWLLPNCLFSCFQGKLIRIQWHQSSQEWGYSVIWALGSPWCPPPPGTRRCAWCWPPSSAAPPPSSAAARWTSWSVILWKHIPYHIHITH